MIAVYGVEKVGEEGSEVHTAFGAEFNRRRAQILARLSHVVDRQAGLCPIIDGAVLITRFNQVT